MSSEQNKIQHGGAHYKKSPLEHWDVVAIYRIDYFRACASKYLLRCWEKAGLLDLEKARHFLQKRMEVADQLGEMTYVPGQVVDHLISVFGVEDKNQAEAIRKAFNCPGDLTYLNELIVDVKKRQSEADRIDTVSARAQELFVTGTPEDGGHHARQPEEVPAEDLLERHPRNCTWAEYRQIQSRVIEHGTKCGSAWGSLYYVDDEGRYEMHTLYRDEYGRA